MLRKVLPEPVYQPQIEDADGVEAWVAARKEEDLYKPEWNRCGLCCVRMLTLGLEFNPPSLEDMYRTAFDAYRVFAVVGERVVGAYHREYADYIEGEFGLPARACGLTVDEVALWLDRCWYVIASVSPDIREGSTELPIHRTGHFVLLYRYCPGFHGDVPRGFRLHNSAGFARTNTQRNVFVPYERFAQCFSGRAILVKGSRD